jgi:hypothetical protein
MPDAQSDIYKGTYKLMEEIKLYWVVQTAVAPAIGYLLSNIDVSSAALNDIVFCVLAFVPTVIGTVYNLAGANYIREARLEAGFPSGKDFLCRWLIVAYLIIGGLIAAILIHALSSLLLPKNFASCIVGIHATRWLTVVGFLLGLCTFGYLSKTTYRRIESPGSHDFQIYLGLPPWSAR